MKQRKNSRNSNISRIYISICLTFSVGSVALLQLQTDGCVYQPRAPAAACWELEVSRKMRKTWPSDTRQPLNRHSSETVEPDALGWRGKQASMFWVFFFFRPATEDRFFIKRRPDQISTKATFCTCTHTRSHTLTHSPLTHLRVTSKETRRLKKMNCRHIKPSVAFKAKLYLLK